MNIGKLKYRVEIHGLQSVSDGSGGQDAEWNKLFETWADVQEKKAERNMTNGQIRFDKPVEILIRKRSANDPGDFDPVDFDSTDFYTSATTGNVDENYSVLYNNKRAILHSSIEENKWMIRLYGYYRL